MGDLRASVCIAAYDKPDYLDRVLKSIFRQPIASSPEVEVIVVDDRSPDERIRWICDNFLVKYIRVDGEPGYRNPARARNVAYRAAKGEVIIAQSDDTIHVTKDCIERLVNDLKPGTFLIAHVFNTDFSGNIIPGNLQNPTYNPLKVYTGPENKRPLFFLGSLFRKDLYAVGGNDEEFTAPSREDDWFARCLMNGLRLKPVYSTDIVGHHLQHQHLAVPENSDPSKEVYSRKFNQASQGLLPWQASGGPWPCE